MGRLAHARFAFRHPADSEPVDRRDARLIDARRERAFAEEDAGRSIGASDVEASAAASFYSPLAREIAALNDNAEREVRLRALGFFGLATRVEVELLRLSTRTPPHSAPKACA